MVASTLLYTYLYGLHPIGLWLGGLGTFFANYFFSKEDSRLMTLAIGISSFSSQVVLRRLTGFHSVCIRTANVRMIVICPSYLRYVVAFRCFVYVYTGRARGFTFLDYRLHSLITSDRYLFLNVRRRISWLMREGVFRFLTFRTTGSHFSARRRFFRTREFHRVVVHASFRAFRSVFLRDLNHGRSGESVEISEASFLDRHRTIFFQRRRIGCTGIVFTFNRAFMANFSVKRRIDRVAFYLRMFSW